ncbi:PAAR domain-containing protein [Escherichia coli]
MGTGYFLVRGDKTTCGGKIIEGADDHTIMGIPQARDMDRVTCGRYPGMFIIVGGVPETDIHGRLMAGTLDSQSSCPCKARFIASMMDDTYETKEGSGTDNQIAGIDQNRLNKEWTDVRGDNTQKKTKHTSEIILITSTIRVYSTNAEVMGDHSAIYFEVSGDSSSPYLYDPNGSYNPYKKLENGNGQRGSGFVFSGEFAKLDDFISYQENPNEVTQNKLDSEWFPYKVKLLSLPVTNDELLTIKNAALALDDGDEEPGSFSCAEWSSKLLKYIIPELDIYTLPNSLWEAVVKEKEKRINLNGENK